MPLKMKALSVLSLVVLSRVTFSIDVPPKDIKGLRVTSFVQDAAACVQKCRGTDVCHFTAYEPNCKVCYEYDCAWVNSANGFVTETRFGGGQGYYCPGNVTLVEVIKDCSTIKETNLPTTAPNIAGHTLQQMPGIGTLLSIGISSLAIFAMA
jgi:hypothetical protein